MINVRFSLFFVLFILGVTTADGVAATAPNSTRFEISFPSSLSSKPLDGRILLILSKDKNGKTAPRMQIHSEQPLKSQQIFGIDVNDLKPGEDAVVGAQAVGFPVEHVSAIPAGAYRIQAVLNRYATYHLGDGKTVQLPTDKGEGQHWNKKPGNLYSEPKVVDINPQRHKTIQIELAKKIRPLPKVHDTKYIKHVKYRSARLTKFWGRPTYVKATILLPEGWASHQEAHYPLMVYQGHFHRTFTGSTHFRPKPPDAKLPAVDMSWLKKHCPNGHKPDACAAHGYTRLQQKYAHQFYKAWTGSHFPRVILVTIQHSNPYFDDSYAVNSANLGPYGDAITKGLIPHIEKKYRGIGKGWARALFGGSTGGWESLADQVFYPTQYNGAYANCPDPIDFRGYGSVNIYQDDNAYYKSGVWPMRIAHPSERDMLGHVLATVEQSNQLERVLGDHARSGGQWDIWQAVYGPQGKDGYPVPIWNKKTGKIDPKVAAYWRKHYDLRAYLKQHWNKIGPDLVGKIHINVGLSDTYYLTNAVYYMEQFLKQTKNPYYAGSVDYGQFAGHCWSGDHNHENFISRLTYVQRFLPKMVKHWLKTAPQGADTTSWRY